MRLLLLKVLVALLFVGGAHAQTAPAQRLDVVSPDSTVRVTFFLENGVPQYQVRRLGADVIRPSRLGFAFKDGAPLDRNLAIVSSERARVDTTWTQPWGEKREIRDHHNELRVHLEETTAPRRRMTVIFRVFDDGFGFRYELPQQPNLDQFEIMDERTEFVLAGDHTAWWVPAYHSNRYEYLYTRSPVSAIDTVHTPLTLETADGLYLSFHEAALIDYASMTLARTDSLTLKADLVPWSDGVKVKAAVPLRTPWRTLQIGDTPGELITSYLTLNLNEPNRLGDVAWAKPGKYIGIWWELHLGRSTWGSGPNHGATTQNAKRYIDFAAEHGFDGVLVEGWNLGWDGDWMRGETTFSFTESYPDFDLHEVARYAEEQGVSLIGHHETGSGIQNYERQMADAFALYDSLGVDVVKTGYVGFGQNVPRPLPDGGVAGEWHHGQYMVRHHRAVLEEAARHQIALNIHEPVRDTGIRRTYPNLMTWEGARGQEYNAWGEEGGNPPEHTVILPFTRMLAGPMDFTPGIFDILLESDDRPDNRIQTTLAKQLALYVVLYSPLQMAADLPENYEGHAAFQFIKDVPVDWEDTRVLHADIGNYVTIARKDRNSDDWYLGSITDELGRTLEAPLSFLDPDTPYVAEIYRDAPGGGWKQDPLATEITRVRVDRTTILDLRLVPGGGQAIRFRPASQEEAERIPPYEPQN